MFSSNITKWWVYILYKLKYIDIFPRVHFQYCKRMKKLNFKHNNLTDAPTVTYQNELHPQATTLHFL